MTWIAPADSGRGYIDGDDVGDLSQRCTGEAWRGLGWLADSSYAVAGVLAQRLES